MDSLLYEAVTGPRLAATLAASGLYGTVSYLVERRIPEIAVRIALGTDTRDVLRLVSGRLAVLTACGLGQGIAGSVFSAKLLSGFVYGVRGTDPATFAWQASSYCL